MTPLNHRAHVVFGTTGTHWGTANQRATRSIPRHHRVQRCHAWPSPYNLFAYGRSRAPISGYGLSSGRGRGGGDGHGS